MKKKFKVISLLLAMIFILSACGGTRNTSGSGGEEGAGGNSATSGDGTYKLSFAHTVSENTPLHEGALEFKKLVEERTGGNVVIEIYPNSSMGDNRAVLESMQFGTIAFTVPNITTLSGYTSRTAVFELPYIIKNEESAKVILDGDISELIYEELPQNDLMCIGNFYQGWRHLTTTNREVHGPTDMKGLKIRTMDTQVHMDFFNATGASAVPMPFSEVFTALQQGAIDGQENPYTNIYTQGYHEVQQYVIETGHVYDIMPFVMSKPAFDKLPTDYQTIILEAAAEVCPMQRQLALDQDNEYKRLIEETGKTTIIELTEEERQTFSDLAQSSYSNYRDRIGGDIIDAVLAAQEGY